MSIFGPLGYSIFGYFPEMAYNRSLQAEAMNYAWLYEQQVDALSRAPLTDTAKTMLLDMPVTVDAWSNALSDAGLALAQLRRKGLISEMKIAPQAWTYDLTKAGQAAAADLRVEQNREIGVYEIAPSGPGRKERRVAA